MVPPTFAALTTSVNLIWHHKHAQKLVSMVITNAIMLLIKITHHKQMEGLMEGFFFLVEFSPPLFDTIRKLTISMISQYLPKAEVRVRVYTIRVLQKGSTLNVPGVNPLSPNLCSHITNPKGIYFKNNVNFSLLSSPKINIPRILTRFYFRMVSSEQYGTKLLS